MKAERQWWLRDPLFWEIVVIPSALFAAAISAMALVMAWLIL